MIRREKNNKSINNNGFTLVELVVVLVIMVIILSLTIFGGLAWQDWTKFKHENTVAEDIFFVAQNQLTELDNSGAMERTVVYPLLAASVDETGVANGFTGDYVLAYSEQDGNPVESPKFTGIKTDNQQEGLRWGAVWKEAQIVGGARANANQKEKRTIISLNAPANKYDEYLKYKNNDTTADIEADAVLLFDLIAPYVTDKSVLNGAIVIEFSPEVGQILSVCYSDKASELVYKDNNSLDAGQVSVLDRKESARRDAMLGYYSVDFLAEKIRGRSEDRSSVKLYLSNKEVLELIVEEKLESDKHITDGDNLVIKLYDGKENRGREITRFSIGLGNEEIGNLSSLPKNLSEANDNPKTVSFHFSTGEFKDYSSENPDGVKFQVPIWWDSNNKQLHIVLDAADVQAGTSSYIKWKNNTEKNPNSNISFQNTYSFYRFGLSDVKTIYASVAKNQETASYSMYYNGTEEYQNEKRYSEVNAGAADLNYYGESPAFGTYQSGNSNETFTINNARHLYNMRFETEFSNDTTPNTFKLTNDIDWNDFVGTNEGRTINYFLNSYPANPNINVGDGKKYGIDYSGYSKATKPDGQPGDSEDSVDRHTSTMPFPGFRCLGKGDKFTQDEGSTYVIKNLKISFAANIAYGVYDDVIETSNTSNNKKDCLADNFAGILGMSDYEAKDSSGSRPARAGMMPLGLFAENLGEISNIILDDHQVIGIETKYEVSSSDVDDVVATNMVGGFVGNNLGEVSNLILKNTSNKTKVSGRTDVGGIIGRESFTVTGGSLSPTLDTLKNESEVSGLENIGGIVGRVYVNYVGDISESRKTYSRNYKNTVTNKEIVNDIDNPRYRYYHDGYDMTDNSKSVFSDESVSRLKSVTIKNCSNRGKISGDSIFATKKVNSTYMANNFSEKVSFNDAHCSFIGGIAGITMDGYIYDSSQIKSGNDYPISEYYEFLEGKFSNVKVVSCDSFCPVNEIEGNPALTRDNYVGGLIGYARLTSFENCNTNPATVDDSNNLLDANGVPKCYVLGNNYVGGMIGCSDVCYFAKGAAQDGNAAPPDYAMTNYNNTIGVHFVGGIAGAFGIGDALEESLSFRDPASNEASVPSLVYDTNWNASNTTERGINSKYLCGRYLLNTAVVLGYKSNTQASVYNYNGTAGPSAIGGVAGALRTCIGDCDNIQPRGVKALATKLITGQNDANYLYSLDLKNVDNYHYGGYQVGGIAGLYLKYGRINPKIKSDGDFRSRVDAIVFGEGFVGGGAGAKLYDEYTDCRNLYPVNEGSESNGMLVVGKYCVGGIIGGGWNSGTSMSKEWNKYGTEGITTGYTVRGVYGVGGLIGYLPSDRMSFQVDLNLPNDQKVKVDGIYYTGGFAGIVEGKEHKKDASVTINHIDITGCYFVGGIYGARYFNETSDAVMFLVTNQSIKLKSDSSVKASFAFAGGIAGLYGGSDYLSFVDYNNKGDAVIGGKLGNIANMLPIDDGSYEMGYKNMLQTTWGNSASNTIDFKTDNTYYDTRVEAPIFAGGLFGFVPDNTNVTIKGFNNRCTITTTSTVDNPNGLPVGKYSFTGGVIGRIPKGMTVTKCSNPMTFVSENNTNVCKYNPASDASYVGGITEVNAGVICGTDTSAMSNYTHMPLYGERKGAVAAFAGVNGVADIKNGDGSVAIAGTDGKDTGVIRNCENHGQIISGGGAAGIACIMEGNSLIVNCVNNGQIFSSKDNSVSAGIVEMSTATFNASNSGSDYWKKILNCKNSGSVNAEVNAAGILGVAGEIDPNDTSGKRIVIDNCVNSGDINVKIGTATGIAISTGMGEIRYSRNYGALLKNNSPVTANGITAGETSVLYGNFTSNFAGQEGDITNPIGPGDNAVVEYKDESTTEYKDTTHIRNFYISTEYSGNLSNTQQEMDRMEQDGVPVETNKTEDGKTIKVTTTTYKYKEDTILWPVALYTYKTQNNTYRLVYQRWDKYYESGLGDFSYELSVAGIKGQLDVFDGLVINWIKDEANYPSVSRADDTESGHKQGFRGIMGAQYEPKQVIVEEEQNTPQNTQQNQAPASVSNIPEVTDNTDSQDGKKGTENRGVGGSDNNVLNDNQDGRPNSTDEVVQNQTNKEPEVNDGNVPENQNIPDSTGDENAEPQGSEEGQTTDNGDEEDRGNTEAGADGQDALNSNQEVAPTAEPDGDSSGEQNEESE